MTNSLALPMYASKPKRRIPETNHVAVTMYRSNDGSVVTYAVFSEDGEESIGAVHFQPKRKYQSRGYTLQAVPGINDERWATLTEFVHVMRQRLGLGA